MVYNQVGFKIKIGKLILNISSQLVEKIKLKMWKNVVYDKYFLISKTEAIFKINLSCREKKAIFVWIHKFILENDQTVIHSVLRLDH